MEAGSKPRAQFSVAGEPLDKERSRICRKACDYIRLTRARQAEHSNLSQSPQPVIVLDTNVVLDWLLFADPSSRALAAAIAQGQIRWVATTAMRDELTEVMRRGLAARRNFDPAVALAGWDAMANTVDQPDPPGTPTVLHCTDPDDQKFIDLAQASGARWLLSRDHAVLRLARRAAQQNLVITVPQGWSAPT